MARTKMTARKSSAGYPFHRKISSGKSSSFSSYLEEFKKQDVRQLLASGSSMVSDDDDSEGDDPQDEDYIPSSNSKSKPGHSSTRLLRRRPTKIQGSFRGVKQPSTSTKPNPPNPTGIPDQVTDWPSCVTALARSLFPDFTTPPATQSKSALPQAGFGSLSTSENRKFAPAPLISELVLASGHGALFPLPALPPPQSAVLTPPNSGGVGNSAALAPIRLPSQMVCRQTGQDTTSMSSTGLESPLSEGVRPGGATFSKQHDRHIMMDVDEPVLRSDQVHGNLAHLLFDPREIKVRHAMLLLRGLLHQIQSHTAVDCEVTFVQAHRSSPLDAVYTSADEEEPFTIEEHLELVMECSSLLSTYAMVYKGRELDEPMIELNEQQDLSNTRISQNLATESEDRSRSPVCVDKAVFTEGPSELLNQVGIENSAAITLQDPTTPTPETTLPDVSVGLTTTTPTDSHILPIEPPSIPPATQFVVSMMRTLADLLDGTSGDDSDEMKRKGRALDMDGSTAFGMPYESPLVSPLLEPIRNFQPKSKEIESIVRLYWMALKRTEEAKLLMQRHRGEMDSLMGNVHKANLEQREMEHAAEGDLPFEILELRRRITALESHFARSRSQTGPDNCPVREGESDILTSTGGPPFHPLEHLFKHKDVAATPSVSYRSGSNAVVTDRISLPIKSQRKFQAIGSYVPVPVTLKHFRGIR